MSIQSTVTPNSMERTRTITWTDPQDAALKARHMSGMDYFNAIGRGEIAYPPLLKTLDLKAVSIEKGVAVFAFEPQEFHYNTIGSVHGGVISAILDSAMGCAVHSLLEAGTGYTTLELKVNFIKAITIKAGLLKAVSKTIHAGKRTALVEAQLTDEAGTIYAHGTSTCLILAS
jgi:uncharacterized protein (TIGR00369 family)